MFPFAIVHLTIIPWDFLLILIVLGTLVPWRGAVRVRRLLDRPSSGPTERLSLYGSTIAYQWLIVAVVAWRALSRGLRPVDLGLTASNPWKITWIAIIFTTLLCSNQWASLRRMTQIPDAQRGLMFKIAEKIMPSSSTEMFVFVLLACTAGLSEEFLYRGFVFTAFVRVFATSSLSVLIAAVLSSIWFAVGHIYQGQRGLITTFVVGMLFAAIRIWTTSLVPSMVAHAGIDIVAGVCLWKYRKAG